jgi:hypothetical protein
MIHIDFQGGAHGNYLEFVCNKIAGITVGAPFNSLGASHKKQYTGIKIFHADHYSSLHIPFVFDKIISIQIDVDDLLPLQQISLLRAGDYGYDNDLLEIDTYNKLNNQDYKWVLEKIVQNFFTGQIQNSYNAVKDPSWPDVTTLEEFANLPDWIQKECTEQHKLELLELSLEKPNCPREILREFFQIGFEQPAHHGFIVRQSQVKYDLTKQEVYQWPFRCFYNMTEFLQQIKKVAGWANISYNCQDSIEELHNEFLQKQPYKNSKIKCDEIVKKIQSNKISISIDLTLIEQAYINAKLGWNYFS